MSLIVIEGLDGSGKGTQVKNLYDSLLAEGQRVKKITFPDYASTSSSLVKMYLAGEFGTDANSVNPYAASSFYAVDRFASFTTNWKTDYELGAVILADRYTTSNIVYQLSKMEQEHWAEFAEWLEDFEYNKLKLPKPDLVIYLDMPPEVSQKLLEKRYHGDLAKKDIHEKDVEFLKKCRECAYFAANKLGWRIISCADMGEPRTIESIHKDVLEAFYNLKK